MTDTAPNGWLNNSAATAYAYEPSELSKSEIFQELLPFLNSRTAALVRTIG